MKTLLIILFAFSLAAEAQCYKLEFAYDDAGNRTSRQILTINCQARKENMAFVDTAKTILTEQKSIILFPNPVKELLNVHFKGDWNLENAQLQVFDNAGKLIFKDPNPKRELQIQFENLPIGAYIIYVLADGKKYDYKVIKE